MVGLLSLGILKRDLTQPFGSHDTRWSCIAPVFLVKPRLYGIWDGEASTSSRNYTPNLAMINCQNCSTNMVRNWSSMRLGNLIGGP